MDVAGDVSEAGAAVDRDAGWRRYSASHIGRIRSGTIGAIGVYLIRTSVRFSFRARFLPIAWPRRHSSASVSLLTDFCGGVDEGVDAADGLGVTGSSFERAGDIRFILAPHEGGGNVRRVSPHRKGATGLNHEGVEAGAGPNDGREPAPSGASLISPSRPSPSSPGSACCWRPSRPASPASAGRAPPDSAEAATASLISPAAMATHVARLMAASTSALLYAATKTLGRPEGRVALRRLPRS